MDFVGKTGTAQVINLTKGTVYNKCENMKYRERHHALFAGFAPADDPQIAVAVIVEHGCHGGSAAAPIARAIIDTYLRKLDPVKYSDAAIAAQVEADKERARKEWRAKMKKASAEKAAAEAAAEDEDVPQTENETLPDAIPAAPDAGVPQ
jgi:penicillin-binding protein 2